MGWLIFQRPKLYSNYWSSSTIVPTNQSSNEDHSCSTTILPLTHHHRLIGAIVLRVNGRIWCWLWPFLRHQIHMAVQWWHSYHANCEISQDAGSWPPDLLQFLLGNPYIQTLIYHCYWEGVTPKIWQEYIEFTTSPPNGFFYGRISRSKRCSKKKHEKRPLWKDEFIYDWKEKIHPTWKT